MNEDQGFTVNDKRQSAGEEVPAGGVDEAQAAEAAKDFEDAAKEDAANRQSGACQGPPSLPEVTFSTFVFSLGTSALVHLGEIPEPTSKQTCQNLPVAKQTIDILGMLKTKTQGNLDHEEQQLLDNLLYELRMKYVAAVRTGD
jgi:hypothetical protein